MNTAAPTTRLLPPAQARRRQMELHRAYFAQLARSPVAARLGVSFETVERQLAQAHRAARKRWPVRDPGALRLADAALVCACLAGSADAWSALTSEHEHALIASAMWTLDEEQAVLLVRRLLAELREHAARPHSRALGLRAYRADRPLRDWLLERVAGRVALLAPTGRRRRAAAVERPLPRAAARRVGAAVYRLADYLPAPEQRPAASAAGAAV